MALEKHLVVMARVPRLGRLKRRLARDLGDLAALRFYRSTAENLLRRLGRDPRWRLWLALTPDPRGLYYSGFRGYLGDIVPQGSGNLGQRMGRQFRDRPPGPVVIIGSDIPAIRASHIAQAFYALGRSDWVFGPAYDGGYWLIGARRRPSLHLPFEKVRWSSATTLNDTIMGLRGPNGSGPKVAYLETLRDIDTGADFRRWKESLAISRGCF